MLLSGAGISVHSIGRSVAPSRWRLGFSFRCRLAAGKILAFGFLPLGGKTASEVLPFGVFGGLPFGYLAFGCLPLGVFAGLPFGRLPFGGESMIPRLDRKSSR